jgi:hypothetical protein
MLKTSGHVKTHYKECCLLYEDFKNRNGVDATFQAFIGSVEGFANPMSEEDKYVFKGDMLEILAEIFFKAFANDPRIGLSDYTPVPLEADYGVDGYGVNAAGKKCAVQMKFRSNPTDSVLYEEMAKTYTSAVLQLHIPLEGDDCLYVFTTAAKTTTACETVFGKMLRVISKDIISHEIDNNINFWNVAFEEIKDTLLSK